MRRPTPSYAALVAGTLLAGCGLTGCGVAGGPSDPGPTQPTTPRALAAAVLRHLDAEPSAIAPLGRAEGVPADAVGIEAALPREVGDNAHLTVVVLPDAGEQWDAGACTDPRCTEETADDGSRLRFSWQPEAPESDPGVVSADVLREDGSLVAVSFSGPPVPQGTPDDLEVTDADTLEAIALDPDVGLETTPDLVAAGDAIDDGVWLDWYGQGNGAPSPTP